MSRHLSDPVRPRTLWVTLLAAPVVATVHFLAVYLAAEAACRPGIDGFGTFALRVVIWSVTGAAAVALVVVGARARRLVRRADDGRAERATGAFLGSTGLMLVGMFAFFVVLVAAPVLGSSLC